MKKYFVLTLSILTFNLIAQKDISPAPACQEFLDYKQSSGIFNTVTP